LSYEPDYGEGPYSDEEEFVEDFARDLNDTGRVNKDMQEVIRDIIKLRNGEKLK